MRKCVVRILNITMVRNQEQHLACERMLLQWASNQQRRVCVCVRCYFESGGKIKECPRIMMMMVCRWWAKCSGAVLMLCVWRSGTRVNRPIDLRRVSALQYWSLFDNSEISATCSPSQSDLTFYVHRLSVKLVKLSRGIDSGQVLSVNAELLISVHISWQYATFSGFFSLCKYIYMLANM